MNIKAGSILFFCSAASLISGAEVLNVSSYGNYTWDFGVTAIWTLLGGSTGVAWTKNSDTARVTMMADAKGEAKLTVDSSYGDVGCHSFETAGEMPVWKYVEIKGDPLTVGAGGINDGIRSVNSYLQISSPIVLGAPQTWSELRATANNQAGAFKIGGGVSSAAGVQTPLVLDGGGLSDPCVLGQNGKRVIFTFSKPETINGSITVTNGAALSLTGFTSPFVNPIDKTQPLILCGASLFVISTPSAPIETDDLAIGPGSSAIRGYNSGQSLSVKSIRRIGLGGTVDFPVSWNGGLSAVYTGSDASAFDGGWLVFNATSLATVGSGGTITQVSEKNDRPNNLRDDVYYVIKNYPDVITTTKEVAPYSFRIAVSNVLDYTGWTITLQKGALISSAADGATIAGGTFRTGFSTGELFLYAFNDMHFAGTFADNGNVPLTLVKGGGGKLTLSGEQSYTGATYLNAGTLKLTDGATVPGQLLQAGYSTLEVGEDGKLAAGNGLHLGGNLKLDEGSSVSLVLASGGGIVLDNAFAKLESEGQSGNITLRLSFPKDVPPTRGKYPLFSWQADTATVAGMTDESFTVVPPKLCTGRLVSEAGKLSYEVTRVNAGLVVFVQ